MQFYDWNMHYVERQKMWNYVDNVVHVQLYMPAASQCTELDIDYFPLLKSIYES